MMLMPPQIEALPRNSDGIPVTWAAAWSGELSVEVRRDPLLTPITGDPSWAYFSSGRDRSGEPRIALPHPERVRRCVIEGLCQVCGEKVDDGPRLLCDIRLGQDQFRFGKRLVPLLIDAWTCHGCIDFSLAECPNLTRRPYVDVLLVSEWLLVPSMERPKWIPDEVPYGPVGFVKIAALEYILFRRSECSQ